MLQTALLGLFRAKVPNKDAVVGAIEDLTNTLAVLEGHNFIVGVDVSEIFAIYLVSLYPFGSVTDFEICSLAPVFTEIYLQIC